MLSAVSASGTQGLQIRDYVPVSESENGFTKKDDYFVLVGNFLFHI